MVSANPALSKPDPRFGIWAQVYGASGSFFHPEDPPYASWERNKRLILETEALGFESTLVAQHVFNPRDDERDQLETWTASTALAAVTNRIEIIAAIKPYLFHPTILAKMASQIEEISQGRFSINLVSAWFKSEFERAGIPFADHDERYEYGREWISVFRSLFTGERVNFAGRHFNIQDYQIRPVGRYRPRPTIYAGGESEQAQALAADTADVWFINGQPPDDVRRLIEAVAARPRQGPPVRFALSAFVVARETAEQAEEELRYLVSLAQQDAPLRQVMATRTDPRAVMFQTFARNPAFGSNGGTAAGLVGTYDTIAARIRQFADLGIETFMLQFQPFEAEMRRFAYEVRPRVERLIKAAA
ncbi:MAG: LLM class flavin-dependent oxidoreductase [Rhodopila sp.]|jgi:alkanesulfonate monooxygenase